MILQLKTLKDNHGCNIICHLQCDQMLARYLAIYSKTNWPKAN